MDLKSLLQPDGRPLKLVAYALAYSLVGASGFLVVAIKFQDYLWALETATFISLCALAVLGTAHLLDRLGMRHRPATALALAVIAGCFATMLLDLYVMEHVFGYEPWPGKPFLYRLSAVRGPLLWWG